MKLPTLSLKKPPEDLGRGVLNRRDILNAYEVTPNHIAFEKDRRLSVMGARYLGDVRRDVFESVDGKGYIVRYDKDIGDAHWSMTRWIAAPSAIELSACDSDALKSFETLWKRYG